MRADIRAEVTLDTVVGVPNRNINSNTALLVCGRTLREGTVSILDEGGYRQLVTALSVNRSLDVVNEVNQILAITSGNRVNEVALSVSPGSGNLNLSPEIR